MFVLMLAGKQNELLCKKHTFLLTKCFENFEDFMEFSNAYFFGFLRKIERQIDR